MQFKLSNVRVDGTTGTGDFFLLYHTKYIRKELKASEVGDSLINLYFSSPRPRPAPVAGASP